MLFNIWFTFALVSSTLAAPTLISRQDSGDSSDPGKIVAEPASQLPTHSSASAPDTTKIFSSPSVNLPSSTSDSSKQTDAPASSSDASPTSSDPAEPSSVSSAASDGPTSSVAASSLTVKPSRPTSSIQQSTSAPSSSAVDSPTTTSNSPSTSSSTPSPSQSSSSSSQSSSSLPVSTSTSVQRPLPTTVERDVYLVKHNLVRAAHGAKELAWSDELEGKAHEWASSCQLRHSNGELGPYGENLVAATGLFTAEKAVDLFLQDGFDSSSFNHFTQVIWKSTTQLGCSVAICDGLLQSGLQAMYHVCLYNPVGNVVGEEK
ncbi:CAP domain-containing protein [Abortiporus biennis]|nr:CAP domain-containing protein [Abortiporus biennis]